MKKILSLVVIAFISVLFLSSNTYAQNNFAHQFKFQLHYFFNFNGDGQYGSNDNQRMRQRTKLNYGNSECTNFIDLDGDGRCDNCDGTGDRDRIQAKDGKTKKSRTGR